MWSKSKQPLVNTTRWPASGRLRTSARNRGEAESFIPLGAVVIDQVLEEISSRRAGPLADLLDLGSTGHITEPPCGFARSRPGRQGRARRRRGPCPRASDVVDLVEGRWRTISRTPIWSARTRAILSRSAVREHRFMSSVSTSCRPTSKASSGARDRHPGSELASSRFGVMQWTQRYFE